MIRLLVAIGLSIAVLGGSAAGTAPEQVSEDFVHFESPHVHPVAMTPDGARLLVVDTPDMRLSVFSLAGGRPTLEREIPVGLEPVSVAARNEEEAWVVNRVSDDVTVVNVRTGRVEATLQAGDEPGDVAFAGTAAPRAYVTLGGENALAVFDPRSRDAPPDRIALAGDEPRALAVNGSGTRVFVTFIAAGNRTTIVPPAVVRAHGGPPPPSPPADASLPKAPDVGLIVRRAGDRWLDERGHDWSDAVPYDVRDVGLAAIDADADTVLTAIEGVGAQAYNAAWNPGNGRVYATATESHNLVRFEPNLRGRFARHRIAIADPARSSAVAAVPLVPPRGAGARVPGQPTDIAWEATGRRGFVAALGSGEVIEIDRAGTITARIAVGAGPSGLAIDTPRGRLYVVNRFDHTISVVDLAARRAILTVPIARSGFDPTPAAVKRGREVFYDGRRSARGDLACATCHPYAGRDRLAWDLGDPRGAFLGPNDPGFPDHQRDPHLRGFHPMKGPMTTQSLRGLTESGPLHWRGDRAGLDAFRPAFRSLLGADREPADGTFEDLRAFLASVRMTPNPRRSADDDGSRAGARAARGRRIFMDERRRGLLRCVDCHAMPSGTNRQIVHASALGDAQDLRVPSLRGLYAKRGFRRASGALNTRGFGFTHDGSVASLMAYLRRPEFTFPGGDAERADVIAFIESFDTGTGPAVGLQVTVDCARRHDPDVAARVRRLIDQARLGRCDVIARGTTDGRTRGFVLESDGRFHADRSAEPPRTTEALLDLACAGGSWTLSGVPPRSGVRSGIDRDRDGYLDGDEEDAGSDPADAASTPAGVRLTPLRLPIVPRSFHR